MLATHEGENVPNNFVLSGSFVAAATDDNTKDTILVVQMVQRPYHFRLFKGCPPQILLGPFLNILPQISPKLIINCQAIDD